LREQWINLAGWETVDAILYGASGEEIIQAVDTTAERYALDGPGQKNARLRRVTHATSQAVQLGASVEQVKMGPISDPAALSIVWRAALGVLVASTSMRPFISLSCSREHDRFKGGASVLYLVPSAVIPCATWLSRASVSSDEWH
jgi:hypothetical protein